MPEIEAETTEPDDLLPEDQTHIEDCTCEHEPEEHGWGTCDVPRCDCTGGWTE